MIDMKKSGSILIAHICPQLKKFCDKFIVLHEGQVVAGTVEELRTQFNQPKAKF